MLNDAFLRCVFERDDVVCHLCATRKSRLSDLLAAEASGCQSFHGEEFLCGTDHSRCEGGVMSVFPTAPVAGWRAEQLPASCAMQIEDGSGADAYWDRAIMERHLVSASSRGRVRAAVLRFTAENETAVQQTALLRPQGYHALHHRRASFEHAAQQYEQTARVQSQAAI